MKSILLASLIFLSYSAAAANVCDPYKTRPETYALLEKLAAKLSYGFGEFCNSPRIMDIFTEEKLVYHLEDDQYHPTSFITLHYNEYSCEYQFDHKVNNWDEQYCYGTF